MKLLSLIILISFLKISFELNDYGKGISSVLELQPTNPEEVNGFISNDLTHEIFDQIPLNPPTSSYESSTFFSIGKKNIFSIYPSSTNEYKKQEITTSNTIPEDLYSNSSDYIYLPENLICKSNTDASVKKSVIFSENTSPLKDS